MSVFMYDLAREAISLIYTGEGAERQSLAHHFSATETIRKVIRRFEGDFEMWLIAFNIVQDWYAQGHERFDGVRHLISDDQPMEGELPECLDPFFWRMVAPQELHGVRSSLP